MALAVMSSNAQGVRLGVPYGHYGAISKIEFSKNNEYLLSSSSEGRVNVWRLHDSTLIYSFKGVGELEGKDYSYRTKAALSPKGKYLVLSDIDSNLKVVELNSGKMVFLVDHSAGIQDFAISSDDSRLLCQSDHASVYALTNGKLVKDFPKWSKTKDVNAGFLGASDTFYTYGSGRVAFWDIQSGKKVKELKDRIETVSPDGKHFITKSLYGGRVSYWETKSLSKMYSKYISWKFLNDIYCTEDNKMVATDFKYKVHYLNLSNGKRIDKLRRFAGIGAMVSPQGTYIGDRYNTSYTPKNSSFYKNEIRIDLISTNERVRTIDLAANGFDHSVNKVNFSQDDSMFAVGLSNGSVLVYDILNDKPPIQLKGEVIGIRSLDVWSKAGLQLLTMENGSIFLEDIERRERIIKLEVNAIGNAQWVDANHFSYGTKDSVFVYSIQQRSCVMRQKAKLVGRSNNGDLLVVRFSDDMYAVLSGTNGKVLSSIRCTRSINHAIVSNDTSALILASSSWKGRGYIYDLKKGKKKASFKNPIKLYKGVNLLDINESATHALVDIESWSYDGRSSLMEIELSSGKISDRFESLSYVYNQAEYLNGRSEILLSGKSGNIVLMQRYVGAVDSVRMEILATRKTTSISSVQLRSGILYSLSEGVSIGVENLKSNELIQLNYLDNDQWIHLHAKGLFDASDGAMKKMYWLQGAEVIEFSRLKHRYYLPFLASEMLQGKAFPKPIDLGRIKLEPKVELGALNNGVLPIKLTKRSGGYGDVAVYINGIEVESNILNDDLDTSAAVIELNYKIGEHPFLSSANGGKNKVEVIAKTKDEIVRGKGVEVDVIVEESEEIKPKFFAIIIGVSEYTNRSMDLKFTTKDAEAMTMAIRLGAEELFGDQVYIYSLHSESNTRPDKPNIKLLFDSVANNARAEDIVLIYLSGHGVNYGGTYGDFYFLTADALSPKAEDYVDEYVRVTQAISSNEITAWLKGVAAQKRVMIIDACGSGKAVENIVASRNVEASQVRAIDRMRDRSGTYVISGCAADAVSFEASRFGQGLLTYSILHGMKGNALRNNKYVDVSSLFSYAQEEVPRLAYDIGGVQKPQVCAPQQGSFDIGILASDLQSQIPLNDVKPIFVRSLFIDGDALDDVLNLSFAFDEQIEDVSYKGDINAVFRDVSYHVEGNRISGIYKQSGNMIKLNYKIKFKGRESNYSVVASSKEELIKEIIDQIRSLDL